MIHERSGVVKPQFDQSQFRKLRTIIPFVLSVAKSKDALSRRERGFEPELSRASFGDERDGNRPKGFQRPGFLLTLNRCSVAVPVV